MDRQMRHLPPIKHELQPVHRPGPSQRLNHLCCPGAHLTDKPRVNQVVCEAKRNGFFRKSATQNASQLDQAGDIQTSGGLQTHIGPWLQRHQCCKASLLLTGSLRIVCRTALHRCNIARQYGTVPGDLHTKQADRFAIRLPQRDELHRHRWSKLPVAAHHS